MQTFTAKYTGTCDSCHAPIHVGDEITYAVGSPIHVECPDNLSEGTSHGFCTSCFTAFPASKVCSNCD